MARTFEIVRFVALRPEKRTWVREATAVEILAPGPMSAMFDLADTPAIGLAEVETLRAVGDADDRRCRILHVLATAERCRRLFVDGYGEVHPPVHERRLTICPHDVEVDSFASRAQYDPDLVQIRFEFDEEKAIFPCLSHDLIVHEVTHALLHRYKGWRQQGAVGEAIADVIAMYSIARHKEVRALAVRESRGDLSVSNVLSRFGEVPKLPPLRDAVTEKTLNDVEGTNRYESALVMTAALYAAFCHALPERAPEERIAGAAEELAGIVFSALRALPQQTAASLDDLANALAAVSPPKWTSILRSALTKRGFSLVDAELDELRTEVARRTSRGLNPVVAGLREWLGPDVTVTAVQQVGPRRRRRWPVAGGFLADFHGFEPSGREIAARAALDGEMRLVTLCRSGAESAAHA